MRCLYRHADRSNLLGGRESPAAQVAKPRRPNSRRSALPEARLTEINQIAATTGNDPTLDTLLLRLHTETACRRGGALAIRRADLDDKQCLVRLWEKGGTSRWQPVSPTLMRHLLAHWDERGDGNPRSTGRLLRYRNRRPITYRRYDGLWVRVGQHLPWAAAQGVSAHWLRHTIITWVETYLRVRGGAGVRRSRGGVR
jgi:site-specific recombinase XerD